MEEPKIIHVGKEKRKEEHYNQYMNDMFDYVWRYAREYMSRVLSEDLLKELDQLKDEYIKHSLFYYSDSLGSNYPIGEWVRGGSKNTSINHIVNMMLWELRKQKKIGPSKHLFAEYKMPFIGWGEEHYYGIKSDDYRRTWGMRWIKIKDPEVKIYDIIEECYYHSTDDNESQDPRDHAELFHKKFITKKKAKQIIRNMFKEVRE